MSLHRTRMLSVGLLLVVGTLGCRDKPAPVVDPEPVAVAESEPVTEGAKQSPSEPELGRDAAIAAIEKLLGVGS